MSVFDSFKGQIGRDAGRVFSNFIWKDKHASVYRRAEDRKSEALKFNKERFEAERDCREQSCIDDKIQLLSVTEMPTDRAELISMLSQLSVLLKSNNYRDVLSADTEKQNKERNRYADAILAKYKETLFMYSSLYPNDALVKHYRSTMKSAKRAKYIRKYSLLLYILVPMILLALFGIIFGN